MTELWELGAVALSRRIAAREVSPVEVMRATLARIDAVNGAVNAIVSLADREALMGAARVAEAMDPGGWLHGIPVAIKDLSAVRGLRATWGSPLLADFVPGADDGIVRRQRAAGAIVIGKTNVPEFGLGSHSVNPVFGATRNPHDLSRSAGGSSGGAAAALATGMVCVADGSDMMGSLRNPAAWCDVWGFRPSVGLVPGEVRDHVLLHRLSTGGPMARGIEDLAAFLGTLSDGAVGPEAAAGAAPRAPRVGFLGDWGGAHAMEAGLLAAGQAALARAASELGWQVAEVAPPMPAEALWRAWCDLRSFAVAQDLGRWWHDPATRARLNPQAAWEVARGLALTGAEVEAAAGMRRRLLAALEAIFARHDALVLPATQVRPFAVGLDWPREIAGRPTDTYHRWMEGMILASLAGLPALAMPAGYGPEGDGPGGDGRGGLPHGLQLIGAPGSDARLLALGRQWEGMMGPRPVVTPGQAARAA